MKKNLTNKDKYVIKELAVQTLKRGRMKIKTEVVEDYLQYLK